MERRHLRLAVHKFASCDGCQLALLNAGETLLALACQHRFVHFPELGPVDPEAPVDVAFVEGAVCTEEERRRIQRIRAHSRHLIALGTCATAGGIQALRNLADGAAWIRDLYPHPEHLDALATATPIAEHVGVDFELWGCPVASDQLLDLLGQLALGLAPRLDDDKLCLECRRAGHPCVLVNAAQPCLGPVTRGGCGALCPAHGRACYGCFGPAEGAQSEALAQRLQALGQREDDVVRRFRFIASHAEPFRRIGAADAGDSPP